MGIYRSITHPPPAADLTVSRSKGRGLHAVVIYDDMDLAILISMSIVIYRLPITDYHFLQHSALLLRQAHTFQQVLVARIVTDRIKCYLPS
jgi:hypothetical protein